MNDHKPKDGKGTKASSVSNKIPSFQPLSQQCFQKKKPPSAKHHFSVAHTTTICHPRYPHHFCFPFPLPFCFLFLFTCASLPDPPDAADSSAGRFLLSTDLSSALARSSAIFSASLLLIDLLSAYISKEVSSRMPPGRFPMDKRGA